MAEGIIQKLREVSHPIIEDPSFVEKLTKHFQSLPTRRARGPRAREGRVIRRKSEGWF